jgi:hypothetical protein
VSLEDSLVDALTSMVATIELSSDEEIDPDVATTIYEPIGAIFRRMSSQDRRRLAELVARSAALETDPARREVIAQFPDSFGLLDDE